MKPATWIGIASVALLWAPGALAGSCQDTLDNNVYPSCSFVADTGEAFTGCIRFTSPGMIGDFDIQANIHSTTLSLSFNGGCSCGAAGSLKNPKFDAAKTFDCLPRLGGLVLAGRAGSSTKITGGHITRQNGSSIIFTCQAPRGPSLGTGHDPCPCEKLGDPCGEVHGACCEGLTCGLSFGGPGTCH